METENLKGQLLVEGLCKEKFYLSYKIQILAYQLTLSQPEGEGYANLITNGPPRPDFRPSYGPAKCIVEYSFITSSPK